MNPEDLAFWNAHNEASLGASAHVTKKEASKIVSDFKTAHKSVAEQWAEMMNAHPSWNLGTVPKSQENLVPVKKPKYFNADFETAGMSMKVYGGKLTAASTQAAAYGLMLKGMIHDELVYTVDAALAEAALAWKYGTHTGRHTKKPKRAPVVPKAVPARPFGESPRKLLL